MLKKRRVIIICSIASAVILTLAAAFFIVLSKAEPKLTLDCKQRQIEALSNYKKSDVKAEVTVLGMTFAIPTKTSGTVDTKKTGEYTLKHTAAFFGNSATVTQKVTVVDTTPPAINTEEENVTVDFISYPIDPDSVKIKFTATDAYDGDITAKVNKVIDKDKCYLSVIDTAGNETIKEINLVFDDGVRPTLTISGPTTIYIAAGGKYAEPGYSAKDNLDGDITNKVVVSGDVDFKKSGTYSILYQVTDNAGNTTKLTRKVVIYGSENANSYTDIKPNGKTVYLTFDDGPGAYTDTLLSHLKKYNVKATFFVTNQFPKYQNLIGKAHSEGHKIAVHTYSHQMYDKNDNIYGSLENFMKDFNKMQDVIEAQTGSTTNIMRFAGGTNNTISKSTCKGIMTELTKQMTAAGYFYFDWNVDSYDSRSYTNTQKVITETINQIKSKENAVVLMHDIHKKTVDAIPAIIEYCLNNGYTFRVLDENSPPVRYKPVN
ncbi:MAG: polysaccharide deacetylase family protein [Clostridia bacterium]|nr:polysaccharide deacetylase family protein [Clostridia bacterium]